MFHTYIYTLKYIYVGQIERDGKITALPLRHSAGLNTCLIAETRLEAQPGRTVLLIGRLGNPAVLFVKTLDADFV